MISVTLVPNVAFHVSYKGLKRDVERFIAPSIMAFVTGILISLLRSSSQPSYRQSWISHLIFVSHVLPLFLSLDCRIPRTVLSDKGQGKLECELERA